MKIGITQGDVNGIGYEVIMKALQDTEIIDDLIPIIYGSPKAAAYHRKALNIAQFSLNNINTPEEAHPKRVNILTCGDDNIKVELGKSSQAAGMAAFEALEAAVRDLSDGKIDAVVTAPINKKNIQNENFHFPGHTEYLEQAAQAPALMLLVAGKLRVGVVAGHVPISQVAQYITQDRILSKLRILNRSLRQDFNIDGPRIAVLGLNPHSGDHGLLGSEEETIIGPAIEKAQAEGICAMGPYPADGLFGSDSLGKFDAILAMYHDQGLAPFKALAFTSGVNFTAGLPIVRTSPDHGTAYDIAGQDKADPTSMREAIYLAMDIVRNRRINQELEANKLTTTVEARTERNA
mgnify:FL=1